MCLSRIDESILILVVCHSTTKWLEGNMGLREKLQKENDEKEFDIYNREQDLVRLKAYLQGLQDAMKMIPKEPDASKPVVLREGSDVAKARDALKKAGQPLHIGDILTAIGKPTDRDSRISLSGSLAAYVRDGKIFTRPHPNTFGLLEFNGSQNRKDEVALVISPEEEKAKAGD